MFFRSKRPVVTRLLLRALSALVLAVGVGMIGATQEARGQEEADPCADTLKVASRAYQNRNYEMAIRLASKCTDWEAVGMATAIQAYRRQGLAFLRQGALVQARSAVVHILEIDSTYTADPVADAPSYSLLVSMVRERRGGGTPESAPKAPQSKRPETSFFVKLGGGLSDYTGDFPSQNTGHPLDLQEFSSGSGFPFLINGEFGYRFNRRWALAVGFQGGNYPTAGYAGLVEDSWRNTPHLLARYTLNPSGQLISLYLDGGLNVTFGGDDPPTNTGYGPSVGGGVEFAVRSGLSFYVESRFHGTLPDDAIDGSDAGGSFIGGMDSVNQLLGVGLKVSFGGGSSASPE